jgi:hypothetical protein
LSYLSKLGLLAYKGTNITAKTCIVSVIVITVKTGIIRFLLFIFEFILDFFVILHEYRNYDYDSADTKSSIIARDRLANSRHIGRTVKCKVKSFPKVNPSEYI